MTKRKDVTTKHVYSKEELDLGRRLYLDFKSVADIVKQTNIDIHSVHYHIKTHWKPERSARQTEILDALTDDKRRQLIEITAHGLSYLEKALQTIVKDEAALSNPNIMKSVADLVFKINHIHALDKGEPTSINESRIKPTSISDIRKLIASDPFAPLIEDADFKELPPEEHQ